MVYLCFKCSLFFYLCFVVLAVILLINMLIAMMGSTYEATMRKATLEWRLRFARLNLRIEQLSRPFGNLFPGLFELQSLGEPPDYRYVSFNSYEARKVRSQVIEMHGVRGDDIFAGLSFDESLENSLSRRDDGGEAALVALRLRRENEQLSELNRKLQRELRQVALGPLSPSSAVSVPSTSRV